MSARTRATLYSATITTAISAVAQTPVIGLVAAKALAIQAKFHRGGSGTTVDVWIQTSLDGGATWFDIANFSFTTSSATKLSVVTVNPATPFTPGTAPGSGALAANTVVDGIIGDRLRALVTTTGTYTTATTLIVDVVAKG